MNTQKTIFFVLSFFLFVSQVAIAQHTTLSPSNGRELEGGSSGVAGVSCCDWMMLKRQRLGAVTLSKDIKADGVEIDMGPLGRRILFENKFRTEPGLMEKFKHTADSLGVKISSIAMSGFFAQNVLKRKFDKGVDMTHEERMQNYRDLMAETITAMKFFGAKVAFLPLGGSEHDWERTGSDAYYELCERLHMLGEMFEKEGLILGVRTAMDAYFDLQMLKDVNCPAVKIYYNVQDACDRLDLPRHQGKPASYATDIVCNDLKVLGAANIAQIHISNTDGKNLREDPEVDMPRIKAQLEAIGYHGWLTVERSRDSRHVRDTRANYGDNVKYLHEIFSVAK